MDKINLETNEYLERFVGQDHVDSNDVQFWYHLLSRSFNFMRVSDPKMVDKTLDPYLVRLTLNNSQSLNIGSLLRVFLDRTSRIKTLNNTYNQTTNPYYVFQAFNALYLLRTITKSYIENLSEEQLIKSFRARIDSAPQPSNAIPSMPQPFAPHPQPQQNQDQNKLQQNLEPNQEQQTIIPSNDIQQNIQQPSPTCHEQNSLKTELTPGAQMLDNYISTLIAIIVDIPLDDSTYPLIVESINALLVLLSSQMYSNASANQLAIYKCFMQKKCSIHALVLTKTLLNNFLDQKPAPQESGSIIIGLASGLWKVLTLGYGQQPEQEEETMAPLARQSLLLLNILTNHCTIGTKNPYRDALMHCQDTNFNLSDPSKSFSDADNEAMVTATTSKSVLTSNSIKIDFQRLFETICRHLDDDQVSLVLYMLLQSNPIFRPFLLTTAAKDLDKLLLPLLNILYSSIEKGSQHVYMVLIIFVILSEENTFNDAIQKITLRNIPWYKERILSEISLASFTALIIIRSFQYNTFRVKDKFLHTNLFATLANLSNHFDDLHPYVCQRLMGFLERLGKRYLMITKPETLSDQSQNLTPQSPNDAFDNPLARALATDSAHYEQQDASSLELDSSSSLAINTKSIQPNGGTINIELQRVQNIQDNNNQKSDLPDATDQQQVNSSGIIIPYETDNSSGQNAMPSPTGSTSGNESIRISMDDNFHDVNTIAEVIKMLLDIINNVLVLRLKDNPNLIYTLLYKRGVFSSLLSSHPSFYNLVINVERILTYSYNQIEAFGRPLTVDEIKTLISDICNNWKFDQDRESQTKLLFHYVEDDQPEEFFIPYIWTRVYYSSMISFDSKRIILFNPDEM